MLDSGFILHTCNLLMTVQTVNMKKQCNLILSTLSLEVTDNILILSDQHKHLTIVGMGHKE